MTQCLIREVLVKYISPNQDNVKLGQWCWSAFLAYRARLLFFGLQLSWFIFSSKEKRPSVAGPFPFAFAAGSPGGLPSRTASRTLRYECDSSSPSYSTADFTKAS